MSKIIEIGWPRPATIRIEVTDADLAACAGGHDRSTGDTPLHLSLRRTLAELFPDQTISPAIGWELVGFVTESAGQSTYAELPKGVKQWHKAWRAGEERGPISFDLEIKQTNPQPPRPPQAVEAVSG